MIIWFNLFWEEIKILSDQSNNKLSLHKKALSIMALMAGIAMWSAGTAYADDTQTTTVDNSAITTATTNVQQQGGQVTDNNKYYYANGQRETGLQTIDGATYYLNPDQGNNYGAAQTGWQNVNNSWYHFNDDGVADTGWYQSAAQNWYYFNNDGTAKTGWYQSQAGNWYYFNNQNAWADKGWQQINNNWYYFDPTNTWADKGWFQSQAGNWYYFDPTNAWADKDWQRINNNWYYFDPTNTWADKGWFQSGAGNWYYFDPTNAWAQTGWQKINGNWYYFDNQNAWALKNWQKINGTWYYFKDSCAMAANESIYDGSNVYWANASGATSQMTGHQAFLASIKQGALDGWKQYGVLPSLTAAQAILESAWGQSKLATAGHNLFGIKGSYNGQSIVMRTAEYGGGGYYYINAAFRRYANNYESIVDHGRFLAQNSRYRNLLWNRNFWDVTNKIRLDGYATAPSYTTSLNNIIRTYGLDAWDREV